jgi:hypothetical protein
MNELRVAASIPADAEKGCGDLQLGEDVQNGGCVLGMRAIVEGQGDTSVGHAVSSTRHRFHGEGPDMSESTNGSSGHAPAAHRYLPICRISDRSSVALCVRWWLRRLPRW